MDRLYYFGIVALCGASLLIGCNSGSSPDESGHAAVQGAGNAAAQPNTDAIAGAATDFLDAVLKGDSQRASARLTPQAIQRISASEMPFNPAGLETATFRIGQIKTPSLDQAVVQCVLTDNTAAEKPEEMCCLLRRVESDWRVSGIAYGNAADRPWTLLDFETGQSTAIPRQRSVQGPAASQPGSEAGGRPSPQRTVQQPVPTTVR